LMVEVVGNRETASVSPGKEGEGHEEGAAPRAPNR